VFAANCRRVLLAACAIAAAALFATPVASAAGGNYAFDGGNRYERLQVTRALAVSRFDWSVVPEQITIHIARGIDSQAVPGQIWLDADLLDAGSFSWGVVQHEYAHEVDFLLLDEADRATLLAALGGNDWCSEELSLPHGTFGCERFASTLAWSYWPSPENCMRPQGPDDESAALPPREFRRLLEGLLAGRRG
jgi:hypothetical protein